MIPSIEINNFLIYGEDMFCMFCGKQVYYSDGPPIYCSHVLFHATDAGYEYKSELVASILPSFDPGDEDGEEDTEYFVDRLKNVDGVPEGSFIIESCAPPPTFLAAYIGFAPSTE